MILNLTQHAATAEQIAAGVTDLNADLRDQLQALLTFESLPSSDAIDERSLDIAQMAHDAGARRAMIGGAPYLMSSLEHALEQIDVQPLYAFSQRISEEQTQPDGTVRKVNVFRHVGFVSAP